METQMETQPSDAAAAEEHRTGFMDLSAELRNAVYELCLISPDTIFIGRSLSSANIIGNAVIFFYRGGRLHLSMSPNLLATCKAIHQEATPILYGSNDFQLGGMSKKNDKDIGTVIWTETIGTSVAFLRNVTFSGAHSQKTLAAALNSLKLATSLVKLAPRLCMRNFRSARTAAEGLYPLMLHLHKSRKGTAKDTVLDILELHGPWAVEIKELLKKKLSI